MSELHCALGIVQLERIEEMLRKRELVAEMYGRCLKGVRAPFVAAGVKKSWFVYVVEVPERDETLRRLRTQGIACSNYFAPIHLQPFYRGQFGAQEGDFPVTEAVSRRTLALPFFNNHKPEEVERICVAVAECVK
jgi:perosamine synthetase